MASSGKKGKKAKGKTVSLTDFLAKGNGNGGSGTTTVTVSAPSWADEMDDDENTMPRGYGNKPEAFVLPTAPRAAQGPDMSDDRIPKEPPYTAYIANLSYDVDTEVVMGFFSELKIKGVRLPRDGDAETGRLKGFGYADFEDRASLVEALAMNDHLLQNRKIRVDLATHAGRGTERSGGFGDRGGSRYGAGGDDEDDRTAGDWRSGPPPPPRDNDRDRGYDRGGSDRGGGDRGGGDRDGSRGFDRYEPPRERGGFDRDERRDGNRGYGFGRDDKDRGFGGDRNRSNDGPRDDRGGYNRREGGGFDRNDRRDDRSRGSPDPSKERPRLQLTKRSERTDSSEEPEGKTKASIFGSAKPVDTAKKEAEIEQKLQESQTRVRTIDLASKRKDEEERRKSSERENEDNKDSEKEIEEKPKTERASNPFGSAKPVDTSAREKEIENKLKQQNLSKASVTVNRKREDSHRSDDGNDKETGPRNTKTQSEHSSNRSCDDDDDRQNIIDVKKPTSSDIFGSAKPVDTQTREREIEERMKKSQKASGSSEDHNVGRRSERSYQPPQRRDEGDNRNRRDNDNRPSGGDRNYDRKDAGRERQRDDGRDSDHKGTPRDDQEVKKDGNEEKTRRDKTPPPIKKIEETNVPNFAGSNKFSFLQEDDEVGSGKGSDSE